MKRTNLFQGGCGVSAACILSLANVIYAAADGPPPTVPDGGQPPGAYPNKTVSGANWIARGGDAFNGNVEMNLAENGPIPWSIVRYNRGDFAIRLNPRDPVAAKSNLNQGFTEVLNATVAEAPGQSWTPHRERGVLLVTARQNGPITWPDNEAPFFPTVAASTGSSGNGYDMITGLFDTGDSDVNTGKAGDVPEGNFNFATTWFPFDQGWIGAEFAPPTGDGVSSFGSPNAHAVGVTPTMLKWLDFPTGSAAYGGLGRLRLPGVNSLEDGMIFTVSTDGASDINVIGVAPSDTGDSWLVTLREDKEVNPEALALMGESEFQFIYVPFNAQRLVGGHINGVNGQTRKGAGQFTVTRTGVGSYELTIPGESAATGALLLQVADLEEGTSEPLASRAFLSYQFADGKFTIQSRKTVSGGADLADASFYFAWVDFADPLAPPAGPTLRSVAPQVVSDGLQVVRETVVAASSHVPQVLVTYVDINNGLGLSDPLTETVSGFVVVGRFHDARTLAPISEPFGILGNLNGQITKCDVEYNPISRQYVVAASGRTYNATANHVPLLAIVNPPTGDTPPSVVKAWAHHTETDQNYDDVALAVSTANGNIMLLAERNFAGEGEGVIGALYKSDGTLLTAPFTRVDLLQQIGDEDDPDVIYLPELDAFFYVSNTDASNGSTGTLVNRIVGSIVDSAPSNTGELVVRTEQPLGNGLPAGRAEGHPATIENPFNGQLITAYDAGNNTSEGELSYFTVGAAPGFAFTSAHDEVSYITSAVAGDPVRHQHPQFAVDRDAGAFILGINAVSSTVGLPNAWGFYVLGPDGLPIPTQFDPAPTFLADTTNPISNSVNYHTVVFSEPAGQFIAAYSADDKARIAAVQITSSHLAEQPRLAIAREGGKIVITWPASATGFQLLSATAVDGSWNPSGLTVTVSGDTNRAETDATGTTRFFLLRKP